MAGNHIRGVNSRGGITLGPRPRDIEREDVRRAVDAARDITLPDDREVLHVLPQEFRVDAQDGIRDAIGMVGQRLEANVHIGHRFRGRHAKYGHRRRIKRASVINDTVLEPLASAEACLTPG